MFLQILMNFEIWWYCVWICLNGLLNCFLVSFGLVQFSDLWWRLWCFMICCFWMCLGTCQPAPPTCWHNKNPRGWAIVKSPCALVQQGHDSPQSGGQSLHEPSDTQGSVLGSKVWSQPCWFLGPGHVQDAVNSDFSRAGFTHRLDLHVGSNYVEFTGFCPRHGCNFLCETQRVRTMETWWRTPIRDSGRAVLWPAARPIQHGTAFQQRVLDCCSKTCNQGQWWAQQGQEQLPGCQQNWRRSFDGRTVSCCQYQGNEGAQWSTCMHMTHRKVSKTNYFNSPEPTWSYIFDPFWSILQGKSIPTILQGAATLLYCTILYDTLCIFVSLCHTLSILIIPYLSLSFLIIPYLSLSIFLNS